MTIKSNAAIKDPVWWICMIGYIALFLISFFSISAVYHQELTSDQAVHVLMANDFSWSQDLYYWGQNRLGSFLPALASFFVGLIPTHPLVVVSFIQYVLIALAFSMLTSGIQNQWLRFALGCMWLLPFPLFAWNLFIAQPYTAQFFFMGLSLWLLRNSQNKKHSGFKRNLFVGLSLLSWMLSAWVNDIMIALLPLYLFYIASPTFSFEKNQASFDLKISIHNAMSKKYFLFALTGLSIGLAFMLYAKEQAYVYRDENAFFSSMTNALDATRSFFKNIYKAATFQVRNVPLSFHTVLLFLALIMAVSPNQKTPEANEDLSQKKWLFFLVLSFCSLVLVLSSRWVEINHYDSRYFVLPYYLFLLALAYRASGMKPSIKRNSFILCLCLAAVLSSVSSLMEHRGTKVGDGRFSFMEQKILAARLGNCAVIGNYRNSYSISAGDPDLIVSTPHEKDHVRNSRTVGAMLKKEKVFLVGNDWLEIFPDTISQFGRVLIRADKPFLAQHLRICEYK